jgi:hypothetical protein
MLANAEVQNEPKISFGKRMAINALKDMASKGLTKTEAVKKMVADGASDAFCYTIIRDYEIKFRGLPVTVSTKIDEDTFRELSALANRLGRGVDDLIAAGIDEILSVHGHKTGTPV